jgi:hypothetical protein
MTSKAPQTIHKQGYLFKQGTFFASWNERYFSLETSLLKQFPDAENALPTVSIYLGTAAVEGLFSPEDNLDNGHGLMWSFVIRWPLPAAPDILEVQWGFMHLAAYEKEEIEEWYDSLVALIKVEQTKRVMQAGARTGINTPQDYFPVPSGHAPSFLTSESAQILSPRFQSAFNQVVEDFDSCALARKWKTVSSDNGGLLAKSATDKALFKFSVAIPKTKAGPKRIWESVLSPNAAKWEPLVKQASASIDNQDVEMKGEKQVLIDQWILATTIGGSEATLACDRVGFRDDRSGIYIVIGIPLETPPESSKRNIAFQSIVWTVESVSERSSVLTVFFRFPDHQSDIVLGFMDMFSSSCLPEAIARPAATRLAGFILSQ